jgi:hypothetical protein
MRAASLCATTTIVTCGSIGALHARLGAHERAHAAMIG